MHIVYCYCIGLCLCWATYHKIWWERCPTSIITLMICTGWYNYTRMVSVCMSVCVCVCACDECMQNYYTYVEYYAVLCTACNTRGTLYWYAVVVYSSCEISHSDANNSISLPQQEAGVGVAGCKSLLLRQSLFPASGIHHFHQCIAEVRIETLAQS